MTQQAHELGMDVPFIGVDGWDGILNVAADISILEGTVYQTPFVYTDPNPVIQAYVEKYQDKTGETPNQFGANAYDAVYVIKAALEKAGSVESEDLIAAMYEIEVEGITGNISFDIEDNGEPNKDVNLIIIEDGKPKTFIFE